MDMIEKIISEFEDIAMEIPKIERQTEKRKRKTTTTNLKPTKQTKKHQRIFKGRRTTGQRVIFL